jgi:DNA-directed RNA polymerase subunit RPC12/RpoP
MKETHEIQKLDACPRCGYEHAIRTTSPETLSETLLCTRCGTQVRSEVENLEDRLYKSGKKKDTPKPKWRAKYNHYTINPVAQFKLKEKGMLGYQMGPVPTDNDLENFRANIKENTDVLEYARVTYLASESDLLGKWVEEDLITGDIEEFSKEPKII